MANKPTRSDARLRWRKSFASLMPAPIRRAINPRRRESRYETLISAFADRLIDAVRRYNTPLCVGLDPFPDRIPALFGEAKGDPAALARFGEAIMDIAAAHAGVFKPQLGLFEPYGPEGVAVARELTK